MVVGIDVEVVVDAIVVEGAVVIDGRPVIVVVVVFDIRQALFALV